FDVIVGIDWLSKRKFMIVCHEKVVRIPLEGDEILRVHGERTQGVVKTLVNTKVEFRIDLVHGATSVAKSPYRLAPLEMQELSEQLRELQDKVLELLRKEKLYAKFTKSEAVKNWEKGRVKLRGVRAMSMTIQSGVKDKILATSSETPKVENAPAETLHDMDQQMEKRADDMGDALSRKERVKLRRVRGKILAAQSEAFKQENVLAERLHGLDQQMERKGDESLYFMDRIWVLLVGSVMDEAHASRDWRESSLIGPELVLEMTNKVVLINEKLKAVRDLRFGKKGKLAPKYVGPFEILERIDPIAYRLRLLEELSSVHDTFHVSNLKKCLADANLHVPLDEIKVDKTLRFFKEPVKIMDREIRKLKRRKIAPVKVRWNSKRGPEFTWEHEDQMRIKYPQLFVDRVVKPAKEDKRRGVEYVMSKILRFYKECLELGPEYVTGMDDEEEVT
ncbi:hypothetical protein Tco_1280366, partial [Tanacetum coccineum]